MDRALLGKVGHSIGLWTRALESDVLLVYFAARDPRAPLLARLLAVIVAAYALSPIDLIPDFIPVLGYLDDVVLVPLGLYVVIRLLPIHVLESARLQAANVPERPRSTAAAVVIVAIWICLAFLAGAALLDADPAMQDVEVPGTESVSAERMGNRLELADSRPSFPRVAAHG